MHLSDTILEQMCALMKNVVKLLYTPINTSRRSVATDSVVDPRLSAGSPPEKFPSNRSTPFFLARNHLNLLLKDR